MNWSPLEIDIVPTSTRGQLSSADGGGPLRNASVAPNGCPQPSGI
jgi:hypothetical protein